MDNEDDDEVFVLFELEAQTVDGLINSRFDEVRNMCSNRKANYFRISSLSDNLRHHVTTLANIPSNVYREYKRKTFRTKKDMFKNAAKVILLIVKAMMSKRKYFLDKWLETFQEHSTEEQKEIEQQRTKSLDQYKNSKSALTYDAINALNTEVSQRDETALKKLTWLLCRLNAFDSLVPQEMLQEIAKKVKYQKFENGRIICEESESAQRLYYIISGKIKLIKKFNLSGGDIYKIVGYLSKGDTTDDEEVERRWIRQTTLVSKGVCEVLYLDDDDLLSIRSHLNESPLIYLKSLPLFSSFLFDDFIKNKEVCISKYYGNNQVISSSSDNSPWLYIVKSGSAKLVKRMQLVDFNRRGSDTKNAEDNKTKPKIYHSDGGLSSHIRTSDAFKTLRKRKDSKAMELFHEQMKLPTIIKSKSSFKSLIGNHIPESTIPTLPKIQNNVRFQCDYEETRDYDRVTKKELLTESINHFDEFKNSRAKRYDGYKMKDGLVVISRLQNGGIFGPNFIDEETAKAKNMYSKRSSSNKNKNEVILLSEGAEVILLSKTMFMKYADMRTLFEVEKLTSNEYMTDEEVRDYLFDKNKWKQYKKSLLKTFTTYQQSKHHLRV